MSATLEQGLFAQYFARPVAGKPEHAPVMKLDGRAYDVAEFYLEDLHELGRVSTTLASVDYFALYFILSNAVVGNVRPAGQMQPSSSVVIRAMSTPGQCTAR